MATVHSVTSLQLKQNMMHTYVKFEFSKSFLSSGEINLSKLIEF